MSAVTRLIDLKLDKNTPCKYAPELYFAPYKERPKARERRESQAKLLCQSCVICLPCREAAHEVPSEGIWGGETATERYAQGIAIPYDAVRQAKRELSDAAKAAGEIVAMPLLQIQSKAS